MKQLRQQNLKVNVQTKVDAYRLQQFLKAVHKEIHENGKDFRIRPLHGLTARDPGATELL